MAVYETPAQVLQAILVRYKRVKRLNKVAGRCFYAPKANTVGCGVGCLLPLEVAKRWDHDIDGGDSTIAAIRVRYTSEYDEYFAYDLFPLLGDIQHAHDREALSVEGFREIVRSMLKGVTE